MPSPYSKEQELAKLSGAVKQVLEARALWATAMVSLGMAFQVNEEKKIEEEKADGSSR